MKPGEPRKISRHKAREVAYEIAEVAVLGARNEGHCSYQVSEENALIVSQELAKIIERLSRYANTDDLYEYKYPDSTARRKDSTR